MNRDTATLDYNTACDLADAKARETGAVHNVWRHGDERVYLVRPTTDSPEAPWQLVAFATPGKGVSMNLPGAKDAPSK